MRSMKIFLLFCCILSVQGRILPRSGIQSGIQSGIRSISLNRLPIQELASRKELKPARQNVRTDTVLGKKPDTTKSVLFLADILCEYYTRIGHVVGITRFCNRAKSGTSKAGDARSKLSVKDLPQLKCEFCQVLGDKACENKNCLTLKISAVDNPLKIRHTELPISKLKIQ